MRIVEGFLANSVSCQQQAFFTTIPDSQAKHAMQPRNAFHSVLFIGMDNGLRITLGTKLVPLLKQLCAQLFIIPDLPIEHKPYITSLVRHRLATTTQIDNAQPCKA